MHNLKKARYNFIKKMYEWLTLDQSQTIFFSDISKIENEYDQEIPQSQTADNPVAPRGRAAQPSQDTRKIN